MRLKPFVRKCIFNIIEFVDCSLCGPHPLTEPVQTHFYRTMNLFSQFLAPLWIILFSRFSENSFTSSNYNCTIMFSHKYIAHFIHVEKRFPKPCKQGYLWVIWNRYLPERTCSNKAGMQRKLIRPAEALPEACGLWDGFPGHFWSSDCIFRRKPPTALMDKRNTTPWHTPDTLIESSLLWICPILQITYNKMP